MAFRLVLKDDFFRRMKGHRGPGCSGSISLVSVITNLMGRFCPPTLTPPLALILLYSQLHRIDRIAAIIGIQGRRGIPTIDGFGNTSGYV